MNKIFKIAFILFITITLSCCDILNDPQPKGSINVGDLKNLTEYTALLGGVYNGVQNYAAQLIFMSDSMTDLVKWELSFVNYRQIAFTSMAANNTVIQNIWDQLYKSINEANIIIANISTIKGATQAQKDNILGQAYFLRALMYYYLVEYYALPWGAKSDNSQLGVPLKLEPVTNTGDFKELKRASVKEVYAQVIDDLKQAAGLDITNEFSGKATHGAVMALRARIALIQERWADAAKFAGQVITSGNYSLSGDVTNYFRNEFGSESIFEIANTKTDTPGGGNTTISVVFNLNTRPGAFVGDAYKSLLKKIITPGQKSALAAQNQKAVDTRITELLTTHAEAPVTLNEYTNSNKYEDGVTLADNIPVIRLSEMILTRAEALAHLTNDPNFPDAKQKSIDLLNEIRTRAIDVKKISGGAGDESLVEFKKSDFSTNEALINAIFRERSVELSFEGHRRTDLQRRHMDVNGKPWNANELVFPIPQSQTDVSDIQQNPGY